MYHYWAYGMNIASEMECPEMLPYKSNVTDLYIRLGKAPASIPDTPLKVVGSMQMSAEHYRLELPICTYYVREGKEIIIDVKPHADEKSLRLFLLANAMAAALHQRRQVALHAGAIVTAHGLVVVCGHSGAGKSTTISALRKKGFAAFADDVVILSQQKGEIAGIASYPIVKLWEDSFEKLALGKVDEDKRIREKIPKYVNSFHKEFIKEPVVIKEIFFLQKQPGFVAPASRTVTGIEAFHHLKEGLYQTSQANTPEYTQQLFQLLSTVAERIPLSLITRGDANNSIEEVTQLITKKIH